MGESPIRLQVQGTAGRHDQRPLAAARPGHRARGQTLHDRLAGLQRALTESPLGLSLAVSRVIGLPQDAGLEVAEIDP